MVKNFKMAICVLIHLCGVVVCCAVLASDEEAAAELGQNVSCIMRLAQYYVNPDTELSSKKDRVKCGTCTKYVVLLTATISCLHIG